MSDEGDVHALVVSVATNVLIVVVIRLSLRIPSGDIIRLYTLFVFVGYFPFEVLNSLREICRFGGAMTLLKESSPRSYVWVDIVYEVFRGFAQTQYKILAVFMIFLNFFLYKRPIAFGKYFTSSRLLRAFQIGWAIIGIIAVLGQVAQHVQPQNSLEEHVILVLLICLQMVITIPFLVMLVFYALALSTIMAYRRQQALQGISQKNQRRQIISVLIYCTPPNIMNSPNLFLAIMNSYYIIQPYASLERAFPGAWLDFRIAIQKMEQIFVMYRMIVITICTLLAFEQYRKLVFPCLYKARKVVNVSFTRSAGATTVQDL